MADEALEVAFIGKDEVTGTIKKITGNIQSNMRKAALAGGALLAGTVALGVGAVKMAADFDSAMRNVNSVAQLPEEQFEQLREKVLDFSLTTRASADDVAGALYNVVSAGFDTTEGFQVMEDASRAAGAGLADTESTSRLLIATLRSYKIPVEDASEVTDIFLQTVNEGITTLPELASGLGRVMPVASSLGVSLDELGFTVGKMTQSGLSTDEALTRLQATFTQLLNPSTELEGAIESLGFATGYDLVQASGGALGAIRELRDAGFLDTTAEAANLFNNVRALGGVMAILSDESTLATGAVEEFGERAEGAVERAREQQYKSLSANIAKLRSAFEAIAIKIGTAVIPAFVKVLEIITPIVREMGANLAPLLERIGEIARDVGGFFEGFFSNLESGMDPLSAAVDALLTWTNLGENMPQEMVDFVIELEEGIRKLIDKVREVVDPVIQWIDNFVELQDVLVAFGVVIASVIIPVIISLITTIAPIIAIFGAVVLAVAFVRQVWENDFLGIRTAIEEFWTETAEPIFNIIREWLAVNIPIAIERLRTFWEDVLLPAIQTVWAWLQDTLIPFLRDVVAWYLQEYLPRAIEVLKWVWEEVLLPAIKAVWNWLSTVLIPFIENVLVPWLEENIPLAIETLREFWEEVLLPAIENVWEFIQNDLVPLFEALWELLEVTGGIVITALQGLWENVLLPAITAVWEFIQENLIPIFESLWEFIKDTLGPILKDAEGWFDAVSDAVGGISGAVQRVIGWIETLTEKLRNIHLPDWLTPSSPTPWEMGLKGISAALREVNQELPRLETSLTVIGSRVPVEQPGDSFSLGGVPLSTSNNQTTTYNLTIVSNAEVASIVQEFELMRAHAVDL